RYRVSIKDKISEYEVIRVALAISLVWLFRQEVPASLRNYIAFMACYQILPEFLYSPAWWREFWYPASVVQMVLGWIVTVELFNIQTHGKTFWDERVLVRLS